MINNLINDGYSVSVMSEKTYKCLIDKQIKGSSKYDSYSIIEYLPRKKEFYVIDDYEQSYEDGSSEYGFTIALKFKGLCFMVSDYGGN